VSVCERAITVMRQRSSLYFAVTIIENELHQTARAYARSHLKACTKVAPVPYL